MRSARSIETSLSGWSTRSVCTRRSIGPSSPQGGTRAVNSPRLAQGLGYHRKVAEGKAEPPPGAAARPFEASRIRSQSKPLRNDQPAQTRKQRLDQEGQKRG